MQKITPSRFSFLVVAFLSAAVARAATPEITEGLVQQRFAKGQEFARDGYGAQALKEYLWCFDEGMVAVPRYNGVRTSFLLDSIKRLANDYEPAQQAMLTHCAEAEKRLLAGDATAGLEFAAWCDALNDERRMMKTFDQLPPDDPRRRGFGMKAFRAFLSKRRYVDALSALPFDTMIRMAEAKLSMMASSPHASDESRDAAINEVLDYIEALAGAKQTAEADEMIAKLKAFDPSGTTRRDIERRVKRAN